MNIRQKKKRRKKFLAMNDFPQEPFQDTQCPYCGFNACDHTNEEIIELGGSCTTTNYGSYFDGSYSGHTWTNVVKCPVCKTVYEFDDSDV